MKRLIISFIFILAGIVAFGQTADDQNYKLGNFKDTQVKAKTVNIGGSWTVSKNSTLKGLDWYYGNTPTFKMSTTGAFYMLALSQTTTPTTTQCPSGHMVLWFNSIDGTSRLVLNKQDTIRTVQLQ